VEAAVEEGAHRVAHLGDGLVARVGRGLRRLLGDRADPSRDADALARLVDRDDLAGGGALHDRVRIAIAVGRLTAQDLEQQCAEAEDVGPLVDVLRVAARPARAPCSAASRPGPARSSSSWRQTPAPTGSGFAMRPQIHSRL